MHATRPRQANLSPHLTTTPQPERIYRREWKLNKPHLPKSTSLPVLQLTPINRPLFLCRRCGFINTLIPLCLWCRWTSEEAHQDFDRSMPRIRRVTAPPRVYWKQVNSPAYQVAFLEIEAEQSSMLRSSEAPAHKSFAKTQISPHTQSACSYKDSIGCRHASWTHPKGSTVADKGPFPHDSPLTFLSNSRTSVVVHNGDKAALPSPYTPAFDKPREMKDAKKPQLSPLSLDEPSEHCWVSKGVDRPHHGLHALKTISTKSLHSPTLIIDLKAAHDPYYDLIKPTDSIPSPVRAQTPVSSKTLRRKKRFSAPRLSTAAGPLTPVVSVPNPTSSPRSSILKSSLPATNANTQHSAAPPLHGPADLHTHGRSDSEPVNNMIRLGHPRRPYYTAIRPNMSRPTSAIELSQTQAAQAQSQDPSSTRPVSMPPPSRPASPGIYSVLSFTSAPTGSSAFESGGGDQGEPGSRTSFSGFFSTPLSTRRAFHGRTNTAVNHRPLVLGGSLPGRHHHRPGFSLSGETELRMALARVQGSGAGAGSADLEEFGAGNSKFKFRDMSKHETKVMRKVNEWKRGFKRLVMGKMSG